MDAPKNPPAFPQAPQKSLMERPPAPAPGMSLRDWFAGQVMEQMIRNSMDDTGGWEFDGVAYHAYALADAMLREREKGGDA